jgi:hypothetical protein
MVHVFAVILAVSSTFQLKILDCVDEQSLRSAIDSQSIERDTKVLVACSGEDTNIAVSRPRYRSSTRTVRAASATDVATEVALLSNTLVFDIPPDEPRAAPTPTAWNTHGALTLGKRHHGFRIAISGGFDTLLSSVIGNDFRYSYGLSNNLELSAGLRIDFFLFYAPVPSIFSPEIAARYKVVSSGNVTLALGLETRLSLNAIGGAVTWLATPALLFSWRFANHWTFDLGMLLGISYGNNAGITGYFFALLPGTRIGFSYVSNARVGFFVQAELQAHIGVRTAADPIIYDGRNPAVVVLLVPRSAAIIGPQWRW